MSDFESEPLTPETLRKGFQKMLERGFEPTQRYITPQAASLYAQFVADPRMAHHSDSDLLEHAIAGVRPSVR